jgi:hypothetical protein
MYEFHTVQEGTGVHPGETFNLDYSLLYSLARTRRFQLQAGLAGYEQRQTTAKTGPGISLAVSEERYAVNGLSRCQQPEAKRQKGGPSPVGQKAEMPDANEAARKQVQQESA